MKMKKISIALLFAGLATLSLTSCDDYFDDVPNNARSLEDVFSNRGETLQWLTNVYSYTSDPMKQRYPGGTCTGMMMIANLEGYLPWQDSDNGKWLDILGPVCIVVSSMPTSIWLTLTSVPICCLMSARQPRLSAVPCVPISTSR